MYEEVTHTTSTLAICGELVSCAYSVSVKRHNFVNTQKKNHSTIKTIYFLEKKNVITAVTHFCEFLNEREKKKKKVEIYRASKLLQKTFFCDKAILKSSLLKVFQHISLSLSARSSYLRAYI